MAETQEGRRTRAQTRSYWASHVESWGRSGQSKQAYCRAHGLSPASFYRWCGKVASGEKAKPVFVPLRLPVVSPGGYVLELILATGQRLRVGEGVDPAWGSRWPERKR